MTEAKAKRIGSRQGLLCSALGVLIAQLTVTAMISSDQGFYKAFFWFTHVDYKINLFVGVAILLLCGHFYGQLAGKAIIIKERNFVFVGFLSSMAVLLTTAFLAGWTGFFQEGIDNIGSDDDPFFDYIFKPLYWVTVFGIVPALIVGIWFGWRVKIKGNRTAHNMGLMHAGP
jgi:hypothetical protein